MSDSSSYISTKSSTFNVSVSFICYSIYLFITISINQLKAKNFMTISLNSESELQAAAPTRRFCWSWRRKTHLLYPRFPTGHCFSLFFSSPLLPQIPTARQQRRVDPLFVFVCVSREFYCHLYYSYY